MLVCGCVCMPVHYDLPVNDICRLWMCLYARPHYEITVNHICLFVDVFVCPSAKIMPLTPLRNYMAPVS